VAAVEAYPDRARNEIYNMLFADDVVALKPATPDGDLATVAADVEAESRVRAVAFRRLKAEGKPAPANAPLLGVVVEIALDEGLDTLAAYADGRIRYINHAGGMSMVEDGTPLRAQADGLLLAAQAVVARIGPWQGDRLPPPPTGQARLTFLVEGELYFGQAPFEALAADPMAGPVLSTATALLTALVNFQGEGQAQATAEGR
jgi:hypothetical protein